MKQNLFLASILRSRTCLNHVVRSNSAILRSLKGSRDRKYLFEERTEPLSGDNGWHDRVEKSRFSFCCRLRAAREEPIDLQWATVHVVESWLAAKTSIGLTRRGNPWLFRVWKRFARRDSQSLWRRCSPCECTSLAMHFHAFCKMTDSLFSFVWAWNRVFITSLLMHSQDFKSLLWHKYKSRRNSND